MPQLPSRFESNDIRPVGGSRVGVGEGRGVDVSVGINEGVSVGSGVEVARGVAIPAHEDKTGLKPNRRIKRKNCLYNMIISFS
jgi:hypothetical protein